MVLPYLNPGVVRARAAARRRAAHASIEEMSPVRRTALISVLAALALIGLKLGAGFASNSLGLVSEGVHSGTDLVAALLTFFALGVAGRPADASHPWGHGKAEHLAALAECLVLLGASMLITVTAIRRLVDDTPPGVDTAWWVFGVLALVIAIDITRTAVSFRTARIHGSPALMSNALHFGSDLAGTIAVIVGLLLVREGYPKADAVAALFVAALVVAAAAQLVRTNVNVLMDRTSPTAEDAARTAIAALGPDIALQRLRVREAAGSHFADVVISVSPSAALAEGHAAADAVEAAVRGALPGCDVVVHVEPATEAGSLTERVLAAALAVAGVREIHNVRVVTNGSDHDVSLHLKLPADARLEHAHEVANDVEAAILAAVPEIRHVATHLEPLATVTAAETVSGADAPEIDAAIRAAIAGTAGITLRDVRLARTGDGTVAFLTVVVSGDPSLDEAHDTGGALRSRLRREITGLEDVFVHTEPESAGADSG